MSVFIAGCSAADYDSEQLAVETDPASVTSDTCLNGKELKKIAVRGQVCLPTDAMEDVFWGVAFSRAGITGQPRGKWIGGFARSYDYPIFFTQEKIDYDSERGFPVDDWKWGAEPEWNIIDRSSFAANLAGIQAGTAHIHVCYGHDCFREYKCPDDKCGLVGSTDPAQSTCRAYLWDDPAGIWFLMESGSSSVCVEAFNRIVGKELREASFSSITYSEDRGYKDYEGVGYPVYFLYDGILHEVSLVARGVDRRTWLTARDFG